MEMVHADVIVGEISCQQKYFLTTFSLFFSFFLLVMASSIENMFLNNYMQTQVILD